MKKPLNFGPKKKARKTPSKESEALTVFWLAKIPYGHICRIEEMRLKLGFTKRIMMKKMVESFLVQGVLHEP